MQRLHNVILLELSVVSEATETLGSSMNTGQHILEY